MSYCCAYLCGACKIFCYMCCCKCCRKEPIVKQEFELLTLGLGGAGKSTLLSKLCGENEEEIGPTKGFSIKDVSLSTAILHVKEVGGSESIRRYWPRYFNGTQGLIFVVDGSSSDEDITLARNELEAALSHNDLREVPLLVLVNKVDTDSIEDIEKLSEKLDIPTLCSLRSFIIDAYDLNDVTQLKTLLEKFVSLVKNNDESTGDKESQNGDEKGRL
eukprot:Seg1723.8 transcript_id=Seg1723.8/GoldUCD/mRNA.D3Y31 product="ADP-ribosylation factor-like protein 15" protein_id=Seg1723.8/GoldUCD/D3Y31